VPSGPDWILEIKYDGYRLRVVREGDRVWLFFKGGHDWTSRYPWIVETVRKIRMTRFLLDGEAVVLGVDGTSDFTPCTPAGTISRSSCMPSTALGWRATISERCPSAHAQSNSGAAPPRPT
jgi:hypothetical protein